MKEIYDELETIVNNLKNRTQRDYDFMGNKTQEIYDRGQIDAYELVLRRLNKL